jgi:hypothetical protein
MMSRTLGLVLVLACSKGPDSAPAPEDATEGERAAAQQDGVCERRSTVTVHVENNSSMDVAISFGSYTPARAAAGFSRTTYEVARSNLQGSIGLRIMRGGVQQGAAPRIPTEPVVCNDATLIIGPRASNYSTTPARQILGVRRPRIRVAVSGRRIKLRRCTLLADGATARPPASCSRVVSWSSATGDSTPLLR